MQRRKVDLPEPEGPSSTTTELGCTCMSMPLSTSRWPKLLWTASALTIGGDASWLGTKESTRSDAMRTSSDWRGRARLPSTASEAPAEVPFQVILPDHQHAGHPQVPDAGRDQHREDLEGTRADRLELEEQLVGDRHEGEQGRVLQHRDRLVAGRRDDHP